MPGFLFSKKIDQHFKSKIMVYKNKKSRKAIPGYTLIPKKGYYQVRKIGLTGARVKEDPAFIITRKLSDEFAAAAKLGKLIRCVMLNDVKITPCAGLLTGALIRIIQTDCTNPVGRRTFQDADFSSLVNFQCNTSLSWQEATTLECKIKEDTKKQQWKLTIPAFTSRSAIKNTHASTHYRIRFVTLSIDLNDMVAEKQIKKTTMLPWKEIKVPKQEFVFNLPAGKTYLHLLGVTIDWYAGGNRAERTLISDIPVPFAIIGVRIDIL